MTKKIMYVIVLLALLLVLSCDDNVVSPNDIANPASKPTNLQYTQLSARCYKLTWKDNSLIEDGYRVDRKENDEEWIINYALLEEDSEEFIDYDIDINCDYSYRVYATKNERVSKYSQLTISSKFVFVEGGAFTMGDRSGEGWDDELPTHQARVSSFYISKYEETQAEYEEVMNKNSNNSSKSRKPVIGVTWFDAIRYCNEKSIKDSLTACYDTLNWSCDFSANGYRLPTEAEWEFAARGGIYDSGYLYSGSDDISSVGWYVEDQFVLLRDVGKKDPNSLGIYDMSGNAHEMCYDRYGAYSSEYQVNPTGPATGSNRVNRGGAYNNMARSCRVASRGYSTPSGYGGNIGFRIVRSAEEISE